MKCKICKHEDTQPGQVTITPERDGTTLVFQQVPAQVCAACGAPKPRTPLSIRLCYNPLEAGGETMEVTVNLPKDVIEDVQAEGLALDTLLSDLLRGEMRRRRAAQQLGEMVAAIRAVEPPLTEAEIQAELDARKAERLANS